FILAVANGFNMMDGSDALCLSASLVSLAALALVAGHEGQPHLVLLASAGAGACLGLLFWNRPPARIYLGDAGSQGLGFLVATLILASGRGEPGQFEFLLPHAAPPIEYKVVVACLLVGWPALEVLLTVARRGLQGRALGVADQGHLHHRLARLGLGPAAIALCAVAFNLLCAAAVLVFLDGDRGLALLLALLLAILVSLGFQRLGYTRIFDRDWLDARRPHFAVARHFVALQIAKLRLANDRDEVVGLVEQSCRELGVHACRVRLRDADGGPWTWSWSEQNPLAPQHVARDHVRVPQTLSQASWTMDAQDQREPELSMNLRVTMVEFMRRVLERLGELERPAA
ncbi:MAG: glycosyltransferase family 4 protein, partial [bacterium]